MGPRRVVHLLVTNTQTNTVRTLLGTSTCCSFACKKQQKIPLQHPSGPQQVAPLLAKINRKYCYATPRDLDMLLVCLLESTENTVMTPLGTSTCCSFACKNHQQIPLRHPSGPQHVARLLVEIDRKYRYDTPRELNMLLVCL